MWIRKIRNSRIAKGLAMYLVLTMLGELARPSMALALTGGPSQPEVESFSPIGTSEMVDVFSGDFNYNIPLMDIGGYPINIAYNSGVTMDQEASWVGLGWNLNAGAITRNMRVMPDDFNGDQVKKEFNMKKNQSFGISAGVSAELFGFDFGSLSLGYSFGVNYNTYAGLGFEQSLSPSVSLSKQNKSGSSALNLGFSLSSNADGLNLSPSISFSQREKQENANGTSMVSKGINIGASFNSRQGLVGVNVGLSVSSSRETTIKGSRKDKVKHSSLAGKKENTTGKGSSRISQSIGSSASFANNTYVPSVEMPKENYSITLRFTLDASLFGVDAAFPFSGYYSEQDLIYKNIDIPAYGYMYMQNGVGKSATQNVLLDFNREKDQPFTQNTPNLPLTNFSYDQFQVSGQGVGGQYRPYRNDVGYVHDAYGYNTSLSGNIGVELGVGNIADIGVDVNVSTVQSNSGNWWNSNELRKNLVFQDVTINDLFEPVHFKQVGELDVDSDPSFAQSIGNKTPLRVDIQGSKFNRYAASKYFTGSGQGINVNSPIRRNARVKRNQVMTHLTKQEVPYAGFEKYVSPHGAGHHISEVTILRPDGARYIYGIPAYNISQKDVTFNATDLSANCGTGLVTYNSGDNTTGNTRGIDHFFQSDEMPAYAHSYLLTSIISSDYVDIDGVAGPSEGDLGSYTKFTYDKTVPEYHWRVPFKSNSASYSEGLKADHTDDKGSYTYGKKELWYISTIETKTHVAVFHTSERRDAKGVAGENGGIGSSSMYKLDKIELYSREEYKLKQNNVPGIHPIKTVHFEYTYDLCPNIENNNGAPENINGQNINTGKGKLTLRKVYFTYENSKIGALSPYEFVYGDQNHDGNEDPFLNAEYNIKGYDRWGNYKPNDGAGCGVSDNIPAPEFPYVDQDKILADRYTAMWTMTDIKLPGGGKISIDYESDDYAYVQDRPAMEMFKIAGLGTTPNYSPDNQLYDTNVDATGESDFLYIDLPAEWLALYGGTPSNTDFKRDFLGWIIGKASSKLYFKFLTKIDDGSLYDYVPGYATILDGGICPNSTTKGYIQVRLEKREAKGNPSATKDVNPFTKTAWLFTQRYLPRTAYNLPDPTQPVGQQLAQALLNSSIIAGIVEMFKGPNGTLRGKGFATEIQLNKSWVRLQNPSGKRLGGGCRVKTVRIWDNWDEMTSQTESIADFGQEYDYTMEENGRIISSGVASYEPLMGGDENPFRQPVGFSDERFMGPKMENYLETPFGEMFFPSPSVGYAKVTVRDLKRPNVTNHATGRVVHEFYTAKDFPTQVAYTDIHPIQDKTSLFGQLFGAGLRDHMTVTQGYTVELNDMHGKPKANWVYPEGKDVAISGVEYKYHATTEEVTIPLLGGNSVIRKYNVLNNNVMTINPDGTAQTREVGVEMDFITDFRESYNYAMSAGVHINTATFVVPPIPIAIPTIFPSFNSSETQFRSAVTTKVVNRFGILKETIAHDLGASVSTKNLAYDSETGDILLTETFNEYEDALYSFTYPAHWMYERMGQAYKNIGAKVSFTIGANGQINSQNILIAGDEILTNTNQIAWVWDNDETDNIVYLIDQFGQPLPAGSATSGKVVRSGRRNQQQVPVGQVTSLTNPLVAQAGGGLKLEFGTGTKILATSATEFNEQWGLFCSAEALPPVEARYMAPPEDGRDTCFLTTNGQFIIDNLKPSSHCFFLVKDPESTQDIGFSNIVSIQPVYPLSANSSQNVLAVMVTYTNGQTELLYIVSIRKCGPLWDCNQGDNCIGPEGEVVNPFLSGVRGNWRALKAWTYLNGRVHAGLSNSNPDQQNDGVFSFFNPFWIFTANGWSKDQTNWTWAAEVTQFSPFGIELENKDALNRYSAEILGYNNTLVKAVGTNTDYNQLAFDGFEDYFQEQADECCPGHFNFIPYSSNLTNLESHTGRFSMQVLPYTNIMCERSLQVLPPSTGPDDVPYTVKGKDVIGAFGPKTYNGTVRYVLSYWVKRKNDNNEKVFTYENFTPMVTFNNSSVNYILSGATTKSKIIDGWQRVEAIFDIPANETGVIQISFNNISSEVHFIDDIRIHPFNGSMKSYVYDPLTFRLWAELDERNFATFYEYDENGTLLRVKKETERGVYTIQESRQGSPKVN